LKSNNLYNKINKFFIIIKKREKSLQEETNKFLSVSKFYINVLQLERVNLSDILLIKRKVSINIHVIF